MWIFYYIDLKTAPKKICFPWLEIQNKPSLAERETLHKQTKNCLFMAGSQHFSPGNIQFQLVYDRG